MPGWHSISDCHDSACIGAPLVEGQYSAQEMPSCTRGLTLKQEYGIYGGGFLQLGEVVWVHAEGNCREELAQLREEVLLLLTHPCLY